MMGKRKSTCYIRYTVMEMRQRMVLLFTHFTPPIAPQQNIRPVLIYVKYNKRFFYIQ